MFCESLCPRSQSDSRTPAGSSLRRSGGWLVGVEGLLVVPCTPSSLQCPTPLLLPRLILQIKKKSKMKCIVLFIGLRPRVICCACFLSSEPAGRCDLSHPEQAESREERRKQELPAGPVQSVHGDLQTGERLGEGSHPGLQPSH